MTTPKYKRIISLLLALVLVLGCLPTNVFAATGSGTSSDPYILDMKDGVSPTIAELASFLTSTCGFWFDKGSYNSDKDWARVSRSGYSNIDIDIDVDNASSTSSAGLVDGTYTAVHKKTYITTWNYATKYFTAKTYYNYTPSVISIDKYPVDQSKITLTAEDGTAITASDGVFKVYQDQYPITVSVPAPDDLTITITLNDVLATDVSVSDGSATATFTDNSIKSGNLVVTYSEPTYATVTGTSNVAGGSVKFTNKNGVTSTGTATDYDCNQVTMTAVAPTGYTFVRWWQINADGTKTKLDSENSKTVQVANVTYLAEFAPKDNMYVATNTTQNVSYTAYELASSISSAASGDTIVLTADATLSEDVTIPSGVTLLLPYDTANTTIGSSSSTTYPYGNYAEAVSNGLSLAGSNTVVKLTVPNEKNITVNGNLVLGGEIGSCSGGRAGQTYGRHSDIELEGTITVKNGGVLSSLGYVYGNGQISAESGAKVYQPFIVCDFNGGSYTAVAYKKREISPFNQYAFINIQSTLNLAYGSMLYGYANLYASDTFNKTTINIMGPSNSSSLITMDSGTQVCMTYDANRAMQSGDYAGIGKTTITIDGNAQFNHMEMDVANNDVETNNLDFPIPYNFTYVIKKGTFTVNSRIKILPGAEIIIDDGAALTLADGGKLLIYDGFSGLQYAADAYPSAANLIGKGYHESGRVIVNGTLNLLKGSSLGGTVEATSDSGKIVVESGVTTEGLQATEGVIYGDSYIIFSANLSNRVVFTLNGKILVGEDWVTLTAGTTYYVCDPDAAKRLDDYEYTKYSGTSKNAEDATYNFQENTVKYGQWVVPKITFSCDCGGTHSDLIGTPGEIVSFPNCTKTGYHLAGWYVDDSYTSEFKATVVPKEDLTLYAKWEANTYTVSFDSNGGDGTMESQTFTYGDAAEPLSANSFTKTGYHFTGWKDESSNTLYSNEQAVSNLTSMQNGTVTLKAQWTPNTYTVTFHANGGEGTMTEQSFTYDVGQTLTANSYKKTGYSFSGWATEENGTKVYDNSASVENLAASGNFDLYAVWSINQYTITFKNTDDTTIDSIQQDYGTAVTQPDNPTKTGYTFGGWYTDKQLTSKLQAFPDTMPADGLTLYAKWDVEVYTITLNLAGGTATGNNPSEYTIDSNSITLSNPTKVGYTFTGWTGTGLNGATQTVTIAKGSTGDRSYTATWSANAYTIVFDSVQGNAVGSITTDYATQVTLPSTTREGYTLLGWATSNNATSPTYQADQTVSGLVAAAGGSITLYAVWKANSYTVSFDANGGEGTMESQTFTYDETAKPLSANRFTKTGYTFAGWNTASDGSGTKYAGGASVKNLTAAQGEEVKLYAQWEANTYTVTFHANGGTGTMTEQSFTYDVEQVLTANLFTKTGYHFTGWKDESSNTLYSNEQAVSNLTSTQNGTVTLYAQWKPNTYTVTFHANGGTGTMDAQSFTYDAEQALTANLFTKTGYHFTGWKDESSNTLYSNEQAVSNLTSTQNGTVTLKAQWQANTYTVSFNANGATSGTMGSQTFIYDETGNLSANSFTKTGYTFAGWNTVSDGSGTAYAGGDSVTNLTSTQNGTVTLYAQWKANTYTVSFDANGATSGTMGSQTFAYDETAKPLSANSFTKTGYTFAGWQDESGNAYSNEQAVRNLTSRQNGTVTLKAQWTPNTYTVTFHANNGGASEATATQQFTYDQEAELTPNGFTKTGYSFNGWAKEVDENGNGTVNYSDKQEVKNLAASGNVNLYAIWSINQYTITFENTGDTTIDSIQQDYGTAVTQPADPTKTGYTFAGWDTEIPATMPAENLTITAKAWIANTYTVSFNANGGDGTMVSQTFTYDETGNLSANSFTKTGYTFTGWNTQADGHGESYVDQANVSNLTTEKDGTVTLYAVWSANEYTVTLNYNGVTVADTVQKEITVTYNQLYTQYLPTSFAPAGYNFKGWKFGDTVLEENAVVATANNHTLVAQWETVNYSISYESDPAGASFGSNPSGYNVSSTDIALRDPTLQGYTFTGWKQINGESETDFNGVITAGTTGNLSLKACFTPNNYKVVFNSNGGTGTMTEQSFVYNVEQELNANTFTAPTGYSFAGWNTEMDGNGTDYAGGDSVKNLTATQDGEVKLYAQWTPNTYTVTFHANNGEETEATSTQDFTYDAEQMLRANSYEKTGYHFTGWNTVSNGSGTAYIDGASVKNLTATQGEDVKLYAQWTPNTYTVTFHANGGTGTMTKQDFTYDAEQTLTANSYKKTGYSFSGWATAQNGTRVYADSASVKNLAASGNVDLYAVWSINQYTITFKNTDDTTIDSIQQDYGTAVTQPDNPTKTGYTFGGWYTDKQLTSQLQDFPATMPAGGRTLYAKWDIEEYTITLNLAGGTATGNNPSEYTIESEDITLSNPTKVGYTFTGWTVTGLNGATQTVTIDKGSTGNKEYTATWSANAYTIVFDSVQGNAVGSITTDYATQVTLPSTTREGYTLLGWATSNNATSATYQADQTVSGLVTQKDGSITLYAVWKANTYTVSFDANGGNEVTNTVSATYDAAYPSLPTATRKGYTFNGWYTAAENGTEVKAGTTIYKNANAVTLYAGWTPNTYTVTFHANGGEGTMDPQSFTYDVGQTLTANLFTKTGYSFSGWATAQNGTKVYDDSASVKNLAASGNFDLYAVWSINKYQITFDSAGGSDVDAIYADYNTYVSAPQEPTRAHYIFDGWLDKDEQQYFKNNVGMNMPANNLALKAAWTPYTYQITVYLVEGATNETNPTSYNIESDTITLSNPTKVGYNFAGWTGTDLTEPTQTVTIAKGSIGDRSYTANWTPIEYTITIDLADGTATGTNPSNYTIESEDITLSNPTREGYTFIGWTGTDLSETTKTVTIPTGSIGNRSYTAVWEIEQYKVEFNADGGTVTPEFKTVTYGQKYGDLPTPTKTGHTFEGWYREVDDTPITSDSIVPDVGDHTLIAHWKINSYTISFEENGGSSVEDIKGEYASNVTAPLAPTKEGHTFAGWYSDKGLSNRYSFSTMPAEDITLYAKWTINQYTITFDTVGGNEISPIRQAYGTPVTKPADPTKAGYRFDSWSSEIPATMPAGDVTITAEYTSYLDLLAGVQSFETEENVNLARSYYSHLTEDQRTTYQTGAYSQHCEAFFARIQELGIKKLRESVIAAENSTNQILANSAKDDDGNPVTLAEMTVVDDLASSTVPVIEGMIIADDYAAIGMLTVPFMTELFAYNSEFEKITHVQSGNEPIVELTGDDQFRIMYAIAAAALKGKELDDGTKVPEDDSGFEIWLRSKMNTLQIGVLDGTSVPIVVTVTTVEGVTYQQEYTIEFFSKTRTITFDTAGGNEIEQQNFDYQAKVDLPVPEREGYTFLNWKNRDETVGQSITIGRTDITLVAQWQREDYAIALELNGGEFSESVGALWENYSYHVESADITLPIPERSGYTFDGWTVNNGDTPQKEVVISQGTTGNLSFKANWTVNQYKIRFDTAGGSEIADITQDYGTAVTAPSAPTKTGYTFTGWDKEIPATMPAENMTIKAQWMANKYLVTLDPNDGTAITSQITVTYGSTYDLPTPNRGDGYGFQGWYTNDNQKVQTGDIVELTANITLTAKWEVGAYTIEYNLDGGTATGSNPTSYTAESGDIVLSNPKRDGYTFLGWSGTDIEGTAESVTIQAGSTGKRSYTANWKVNQYTITFKTDGGSEIEAITQDYGTAVTAPSNPTKTGYTFTGWDNAIPTTMPAQNLTITAKWQINQYTITFQNSDGTVLKTSTQDYGTQIVAPTAPVKEGYTFDGWDATVPETMPAENITVKAQYKVISYTVYYCDTGSESAVLREQVVNYGESIPAVAVPVKEGYIFGGWTGLLEKMPANDLYVYATWTTEQYNLVFKVDGEEYQRVKVAFGDVPGTIDAPAKTGYTFSGWREIPPTMPAKDVIVEGSFTANTYTIKFQPNGALGEMESMTVTYDETVALTACGYTKTGYNFAGWNTAADGSGTSYADQEQVKNLTSVNGAQITLYAIWTAKTYDVTLDYNDGVAGEEKVTVTYDGTYKALPVPTRTGYDFAGWSDGINFYTTSTPVTEPVPTKLTAQWTAQGDTPYTVYHYQQNLDNDQYTLVETQKLTGATDASATATAKSYTGFAMNAQRSIASGTIAADGSLELKLYYDRVQYTVTWQVAGEQVQEQYRYGQTPVYNGQKNYEDLYAIYTFTGWDADLVEVTENVTYTARYTSSYEASFFNSSTGEVTLTYARLANALAAATNGQTVRLEDDITLSEDLTVPAGVTLLLPCQDNDTGYNLVNNGQLKFNHDNPGTSGTASLYRTLTIPENVTLTVKGTVMIDSLSGRKSGGTAEMDITGGYAEIALNGDIVVADGGALDCFGYVTGSGTVTAESGGAVGDLYIVRHWRGGSQALAMYQSTITYSDGAKRQTYPMNEYDCHNIETDVVIKYGASYDGMVKMCANAGSGNAYYYTRFPQVDVSNGLIRLTSEDGYVVRSYDETTGEEIYRIYGGANFANSSLTITGVSLSTKDFVYPIDGDITFELYNGDYHFVNDYKFLTGGGMTVYSGASLTVNAGTHVAFYDEFHDPVNTGYTQYPERAKAVLTIKKGGKFTNAGTFGGSIVTESADILVGDDPVWGITTLEANGYTNGTVRIDHDLNITRGGYTWKYGESALGEIANSIIWTGADYTELNAALETVPKNLDIYADDIADALEAVLNEIQLDLGMDKQEQVDEWTAKIEEYVSKLTLRVVTVTLNANGGTVEPDSIKITYGDLYGTMPEPEYYGFTFKGWYDQDNELITAETKMQEIVDNITLTAKWEKIPADYSVVNQAIAEIPADLTGYTADSIQALNNARDAVDMTLGLAEQEQVNAMARAILDAIDNLDRVEVTISFDANGGADITETLKRYYNDLYPYDQLPIPTRDGYEFVAWYTAREGGIEITANTRVTSETDVILYAKWSDNSSTEPADYTSVEEAKAKVPADLTCYSAASVNRLQQTLDAVVYDLTADRQADINAWAAAIEQAVSELEYKSITIYFDPVSGNCDEKSMQVTCGTPPEALPVASQDYYEFLGWYTAKEGGEKIEPADLANWTENQILYAQYKLLNADYSRVNEILNKIPTDLSCYSDESVQALETAMEQIQEGYTAERQSVVDKWAEQLEAAYEGLTYRTVTITYNPQGGKVSPKSVEVQYSSMITVLPEPEYNYHVFDGWFTEPEGGEQVTAETQVTSVEDFTLYAHWTQIDADYTRVYAALEKVPNEEELQYYTDDTVSNLRAAIDAVQYDLSKEYQIQVNNWANDINRAVTKLKYKAVTVTFVYNGGTKGLYSCVIRYNSTYGTLPTTTREGYTFLGWYTANSGGEKVESNTVMQTLEDHSLYAHWGVGDSAEPTTPSTEPTTPSTAPTAPSTAPTAPSTEPTTPSTAPTNPSVAPTAPSTEPTTPSTAPTNPTTEPTEPSTEPTVPTTEATTNEDGSVTTTTKDEQGTVTEITEKVDGSVTTVVTQTDGTVTTTDISTTTETDKNGSAVTVEQKVEKVASSDGKTTASSTTTTVKSSDSTVVVKEQTVVDDKGNETTTSTTQVEMADGSTSTTTVDAQGTVKVDVALSEAAASSANVTLPIQEVSKTNDTQTATAITVTTVSKTPVTVTIPVKETSAGTVAVLVNEDGSEKVISSTVMSDDGVVITIPEDATIKIVDNSQNFDDVSGDSWYNDAVDFASSRNLTNGVGNDLFNPDGTVTRAQFITMLYRLAGEPVGYKAAGFQDVEDGQWYTEAINWAAAEGITNGYGNGLFGINDEITREQMAAMMYRYAEGENTNHDLSHFNDAHTISDYAVEALAWANANGIINGMGNGTLDPRGDAKRSQAAQILMNYIQNGI